MIKTCISKFINILGLNIVGYHYIYEIPTYLEQNYTFEIVGLGGKTTLLNKIHLKLDILRKTKPTISEKELRYNDEILLNTNHNLFSFLINPLLSSANPYYRIKRVIDKLVIQSKYGIKSSLILDEGIIKENIDLINLAFESNSDDISMVFCHYKFIIILPELEIIISRYFNRKKIPKHKSVQYIDHLSKNYNEYLKLIIQLKKYNIEHLVLSDSDEINTNKAVSYIKGFVNSSIVSS